LAHPDVWGLGKPLENLRALARKIVVIGGYGDSLHNFRGNLLKALTARNHTVIACAPAASARTKQFLESASVEYNDIPLKRTSLNPLADISTIITLARVLDKKRPDVVFGYTIKAIIYTGLVLGLLNMATLTRKQPKFIALITGLGSVFIPKKNQNLKEKLLPIFVKILYRWSLSQAECVIFQNPDDQKYFQEHEIVKKGKNLACVAGSGIDFELFKPHPISPQPTFLMVARLLGDKGVREYVQAARYVRQSYPKARFQLAGGLDENPTSVSAKELEGWVHERVIQYLGELEDVQPALAECRFYVLPSYREGMPRSVLEAMAMGRPILTTDVPGCKETVQPGKNGFLVPPRDWQALAQAMVLLLNQTEAETLKMAHESLVLAKEKFDVRLINSELVKILEA